MNEFKFSPAALSNLLFWQKVKCKAKPRVFWVKPLKSGSIVYAYGDMGKPCEFEYFPYCPKA